MERMPEIGLVRPVTGLVLHWYGSFTAVTANSAPAGMGKPTRMRPLEVNNWYACCLAARVETSAFGHVAPSTRRKIGSAPALAAKRFATSAALTLQPFCG